jgi:hypothetical protein
MMIFRKEDSNWMMEYEEMKFDFWDGNDKIFNLIVLHLKRNFILILKFGDL